MPEHTDPPEETRHLIARYQEGDRASGEELCDRYYPRVRRIVLVRARAWGLQLADVEEVLQETFLAATRSIQRFQALGEGGFIQWLATIAGNKLIDLEKRAHALRCDRDREVPMADLAPPGSSSSVVWQPAGESTQIPDRVAREEELRYTDECLARMREDYREVIVLRNLAGCSWRTVVAEMGSPSVESARKLYSRARAALAAERKRGRHGL